MRRNTYKNLIIFLVPFLGASYSAYGQDFYKDYKSYLMSTKPVNSKPRKQVDSLVKWMRMTILKSKQESKIDLLGADTIYIVSLYGVENASKSKIIWSRLGSCYYRKEVRQKPEVTANASEILKSFNNGFRESIEKGDTAAYHKYADTHKVFDGEWVTPVMAIKKGNHWFFTVFKGNGWAINYDFEPPDKK